MDWIVTDIDENTNAYIKELVQTRKNERESNKKLKNENKEEKNETKNEKEYKMPLIYYFLLGLLNSVLFYIIFLRYHNTDDILKDVDAVQKIAVNAYDLVLQCYGLCAEHVSEIIKKYIQ